ncbi:MAG: hypothetical protein PHQ52_03155 [Candidatus Omnitrophica bacterium]|nr:hypothetical protein [Candidatus Omnitrophota bacterium]
MAKVLFAVLMFLFVFGENLLAWDDHQDRSTAYQKGYKDGYTYNPNSSVKAVAPVAPVAPIPYVGQDANGMYIRGVLDGQKSRGK